MSGATRLMVATNAFGMGIDKSDIPSSSITRCRAALTPTTRKPAARAATGNPPIACCYSV
jgi:hypothetical protein